MLRKAQLPRMSAYSGVLYALGAATAALGACTACGNCALEGGMPACCSVLGAVFITTSCSQIAALSSKEGTASDVTVTCVLIAGTVVASAAAFTAAANVDCRAPVFGSEGFGVVPDEQRFPIEYVHNTISFVCCSARSLQSSCSTVASKGYKALECH